MLNELAINDIPNFTHRPKYITPNSIFCFVVFFQPYYTHQANININAATSYSYEQ